jgi:limonene-1,2-epoxide hydrolase
MSAASDVTRAIRWIERYGDAWRTKDDTAAARLFSEDASYQSHPLRAPHVGRAAIAAYWRAATETQLDLDLRFGRPITEDNRVAVEWWASGEEADGDFTLPGCLVLTFDDDGLCRDLREYWNIGDGRHQPLPSWGS